MEKCITSMFMFLFLFFSVFSINKFSVKEICHTLDSKIIFSSPSITISHSRYLSHFLFLFYISSLLFPSTSSTNLSILSSTSFLSLLLRYISRIFFRFYNIYIGEEKRTYKWVRELLLKSKAYFCMKYDPEELNI